ncbi:MAG: hypothetical protein HY811_08695 [Planctomycetes bacterium]|nr:hypothetical protein [Planctomycetota bacterium]
MPINELTSGQIIEAWLAVGFTLMIYSFLYKDNPVFKLGEYMYVGLTAGWGLCVAWYMVVWPDLVSPLSRVIGSYFGKQLEKPLEPHETLWLFIPLILGVFMLTRFSQKIGWLSRYTFAFIMGAVSGMAIPLVVSADIFKQMVPTLNPLWTSADASFLAIMNSFLILIGVISVLIYFFFSLEHKGVVKVVSKIGIFYMMVAFGASFGYTVMARESLAIGRITKLVNWAGKEYYYATIILFLVVVIFIVLYEIINRLKKQQTPPAE